MGPGTDFRCETAGAEDAADGGDGGRKAARAVSWPATRVQERQPLSPPVDPDEDDGEVVGRLQRRAAPVPEDVGRQVGPASDHRHLAPIQAIVVETGFWAVCGV